MIIARSEKVVLPNSDDGKFMADQYANDMLNAGMEVSVEASTTGTITVNGHFVGELKDEYVRKLIERSKE